MENLNNLSDEVKKIVYEELPRIIKEQPGARFAIWEILSSEFAPKKETEDKFEKLLHEIHVQADRFDRKFEQIFKKLEENDRKFEQNNRKFEQIFKKLEENDRKFEQNNRKFERMFKTLEEYSKKFEENDRKFEELLKEIRSVDRRIDRTIGALGARWGLATEHAFREAIKAVLEDLTNMRVDRYLSYDNEGIVFGYPDQVEIDVVATNGELWLMEIKSSISKAEVYIFDRKVKFYEQEKGRKADRKLIISPMFGPGAMEVAEKLEIETYTAPEDIRR